MYVSIKKEEGKPIRKSKVKQFYICPNCQEEFYFEVMDSWTVRCPKCKCIIEYLGKT